MISFDPNFAKQFGLHEAIIFERLKILLTKNIENFQNYYETKFWVDLNLHIYNNFLFFIPQQDVDYALENLKKRKVIEELKINDHNLYTISEKYKD